MIFNSICYLGLKYCNTFQPYLCIYILRFDFRNKLHVFHGNRNRSRYSIYYKATGVLHQLKLGQMSFYQIEKHWKTLENIYILEFIIHIYYSTYHKCCVWNRYSILISEIKSYLSIYWGSINWVENLMRIKNKQRYTFHI